ncbi:MAG: radical SAM protein [Nanoarchaeota archaeon]|nr:radical SAM protein [Nanoarchaeota archaeon]
MKIKLIRPKAEVSFQHTNFYFFPSKPCMFFAAPLSIATIAALTPKEDCVEISDEYIEEINFEEPVDLVGISVFNMFVSSRAYKIASAYRQRKVKVVFGGLHTSLFPEECLEYADAIVIGEAEDLWGKVIADFKKGQLKKVYSCKKRPDLKNRPMPRWDLVNLQAYTAITLMATRGCPNQCEFCIAKFHLGNKPRHKPVNEIVEEINEIKRLYGRQPYLWFADYNFTTDKKYAKELMRSLIPLGIKYACITSMDIYKDTEILELLVRSGCNNVAIGLESNDYRNIAYLKKDKVNNVNEYAEAIKKIQSYGLQVLSTLMIGNEYDNERTFKDLESFVEENDIITPFIFPAGILPCTPLHRNLKNKKEVKQSEFDLHHYSLIRSAFMDTPEFWIYYTRMFYSIYSYKSVFKRLIRFIIKQRRYSKCVRYNRYAGYFSFRNAYQILKRLPRAIKVGMLTRNVWSIGLALISEFHLNYAAWQQVSCSKIFLKAYSNLMLDKCSRDRAVCLRGSPLLRLVRKLSNESTKQLIVEKDAKKI